MSKMKKADLVRAVQTILLSASGVRGSRATARRVLGRLLQVIQHEVLAGNTVSIAGFGVFKPRAVRTTGKRPDGRRWTRETQQVSISFKPFAKSGANSYNAKGARRVKLEGEAVTSTGAVLRVAEAVPEMSGAV